MSADLAPTRTTTLPDRLLVRAFALVVAAGLGLALVGQIAAHRIAARDARAAELVLIASTQAAIARQITAHLDRMTRITDGAARRTAEAVLSAEIDRLIAKDRERLALAGAVYAGAPEEARRTALLFGVDILANGVRRIAPEEVPRLRNVFAAEIAPEFDFIARGLAADAAAVRSAGRRELVAATLAQLFALLAIAVAVAGSAIARTRAFIAAAAAAEAAARRRLLHDPLTELPNAAYLEGVLAHLVAGAARRPVEVAVLRLELDRFETLRETLGQRTADEIIRIAGRRVQQVLRAGDFAAHLGQDDFVVVVTDLADPRDATALAQRLHAAMSLPMAIRGGARRIGCSIGVTLLSDDRPEAERLLGNAGIALGEARAGGLGGIRYFREHMRAEVERREALCAELLGGLARGEVVPYFQPQFALATGAFTGFEALARWHHPGRGVLSPCDFLDFAEQADLTERLGEEILGGVLRALAAWDAAGLAVPSVGVNFALAQLRDPCLIERIKWEVERFDIDPSRIAIEVLETVLIKSDADLVVRNLRGLAAAGFRIELDDFGTGHASISNLRRFMVDRIKIDGSFVQGIETSAEQRKLTAAMIAMARALGIRTLAEAVETPAAEDVLRALGCDDFQGYLMASPMDHEAATAWLATRLAPAASPGDGGDRTKR